VGGAGASWALAETLNPQTAATERRQNLTNDFMDIPSLAV
jgi:hypothetical protein